MFLKQLLSTTSRSRCIRCHGSYLRISSKHESLWCELDKATCLQNILRRILLINKQIGGPSFTSVGGQVECSLGNTKQSNKILSQFWAFQSTDLVKLNFKVIMCTSGCVLVVGTGVLGLSLACSECDTCLAWIVFYKKGCVFHSTSVHKQRWTEGLEAALMLGIFS